MGSKLITIIGNDRVATKNVIAEEQLSFILSLLLASGISEQTLLACLTDGEISSVQNKIDFRKLCEREQISIADDTSGGLKIYLKSDNQDVLIAEWYKPEYVIRIKSRKLFTEIHTSWWTFEENDGKNK